MSLKKKIYMILLNSGIVVGNIVLFSNIFLGLSLIEGTALSIGAAWTSVLASTYAFVRGNLLIMKKEDIHLLTQNVKSLNDCLPVLEEAIHNGDAFDDNLKKNINQIKRFNRKLNTIKNILLQKFQTDELTFRKFNAVLDNIEKVVYINVCSILNKISAFDVEDYDGLMKNKDSLALVPPEKIEIYNKYLEFVDNSTKINEDILLKMDKMVLEISKYNSIDGGDVKKLPAVVEMDELIKNASRYK